MVQTGGTARHPVATERLMEYWAHGEGAAKIGWGTPGDFNRCRVNLGKYVHSPNVLAGLCANLHHRATGFWPGRAPSEQRDAMLETGSAGALLPVAKQLIVPPHLFKPSATDRRKCAVCGKGPGADAHLEAMGTRHAGPGHDPARTGHFSHRRRQTVAAVTEHADQLETQLRETMAGLFDRQRKATLARMGGKRGRQMLRAAQDEPPPGQEKPPTPLIDPQAVFDPGHWIAETTQAVGPVFATLTDLTGRRLAREFTAGPHDAALAAARAAAAGRRSRLAETVTSTTYNAIRDTLAEGLREGESMGQLTARVQHVFDQASSTRAETIARTEVIGGLTGASLAYADALPPGTVAAKEWISAHDTRVRHAHREADGQLQPLGKPFHVGGFLMQGPHDPSGPPEQTINCRCVPLFHPTARALAVPAQQQAVA